MGDTCSTCGYDEKCIQGFEQKEEGKRACGRPRQIEDNVEMALKEIEGRLHTVYIWLRTCQWQAYMNTIMNF